MHVIINSAWSPVADRPLHASSLLSKEEHKKKRFGFDFGNSTEAQAGNTIGYNTITGFRNNKQSRVAHFWAPTFFSDFFFYSPPDNKRQKHTVIW